MVKDITFVMEKEKFVNFLPYLGLGFFSAQGVLVLLK